MYHINFGLYNYNVIEYQFIKNRKKGKTGEEKVKNAYLVKKLINKVIWHCQIGVGGQKPKNRLF